MRTTGERLRHLRENRNLSQAEVADAIHVERTTYAKYESNVNKPSRKLNELAAFFGVSADYILCRTDNPIIPILQTDESTPFGRAVAKAKKSYYHDPKVSAIVDELKNRPGMRILFDASRDLSEEDIRFVVQLVERMKRGKSDE